MVVSSVASASPGRAVKGKKLEAKKDGKGKKHGKPVMTKVSELDKQVQKLAKEFASNST